MAVLGLSSPRRWLLGSVARDAGVREGDETDVEVDVDLGA